MRLFLAALTAALAVPAAAQTLPGPLAAFAAERAAECTAMGGAPRIGPAFATPVDLTGDGALDYIVDLAGVECVNAWSAFCGSAGCPVSVWIAGPEGLSTAWADYAQGWTIDGAGDTLAVLVDRHGSACPGAASGADGCRERLVFAAAPEAAAAAPPVEAATPAEASPAEAPAAAAEAAAGAGVAAPAEALAAPAVEGWTLREVPGGSPVAVSEAPGAFAAVAIFCLSGQPWLALTPRAPLEAAAAQVEFAFADRSVSSTASREDQAGGALVIDLADRPLAGLLAGRDSSTRVTLDGAEQGVLSLRGSTRAIRGALAACAPL